MTGKSKENHEKYFISFSFYKYCSCAMKLTFVNEHLDFLIYKITLLKYLFISVDAITEFQTPDFNNIVKIYIFKLYQNNPTQL